MNYLKFLIILLFLKLHGITRSNYIIDCYDNFIKTEVLNNSNTYFRVLSYHIKRVSNIIDKKIKKGNTGYV